MRKQTDNSIRNRVAISTTESPSTANALTLSPLRLVGIALLLITCCIVVFGGVIQNDFVIWDDGLNVYSNPYLNPPSAAHIQHFWTQKTMGDQEGITVYRPVVYTLYAAIAEISQLPTPRHIAGAATSNLNPAMFHAANLAVHILNVMVIFLLLRLIIASLRRVDEPNAISQRRIDWAACAGALLFAIHPVQVEPVAWITGLTDLLGGLFSLLALWQYLCFSLGNRSGKAEYRNGLHFVLATVCFVLALLSKPSTVTVPVVAWILEYFIAGRPGRRSYVALGSWILLSVAAVFVTRWAEPILTPISTIPLWQRPVVAADALAFYLMQLAWPSHLGIDYGRTPKSVLSQPLSYLVLLVPLLMGVVAFRWRRRFPWLSLGICVFVVTVLPVLGLIPFRFQNYSTVTDRYLYLSLLGPAIILACSSCRINARAVLPTAGAFAAIILVLALQSSVQIVYWRTNQSLFRHAVEINPRSAMSHHNLGLSLEKPKMPPEVEAQFNEALRLNPYDLETHNDLGYLLMYQRRWPEAINHFYAVLRLRPTQSDAHSALGLALLNLGRWQEASDEFELRLQAEPGDVKAHFYLGMALMKQGNKEAAISEFQTVLRIAPGYSPAAQALHAALDQRDGRLPGK